MLRSSGEIRLLGLPYRTIFIGLGISAALLILLLILQFPPSHSRIEEWASMDELLVHVRADWRRLSLISSLLGITTAAAILTVYSYLATKEKLMQVQSAARTILNSLVGGVLTLDNEGRVTIINKAAIRILEIDPTAPYPDLTELSTRHPQLGEVIRKALVQKDYVQDHDSTFISAKGAVVHLRTNFSEQIKEDGGRAGIVVLVKDVTKLVAMERELRKRDRLAAAGTLAAGVAHEIRNPLSALELNLRLLHDDVSGPNPSREEIEGYFEVLFAETRRLNRITTNFLQLSRAGPIVKSLLPVHKPLVQVLRLLETEAKEKRISFETDLTTENAVVLGDHTKLEQVCLNILINAMQSMSDGGIIQIASRINHSDDGEVVDLSFVDHGIGIPAENIPQLFDPYFTTRDDGTGLGLAIADRIVTDHGGKILVASSPGTGTTMTVRLPLVQKEVSA